ncbi:MAG TPA: hypothetical protein VFE62_02570 [Gemmataceae bacterium]|nr:hypothetical protein [Gemmataceae bacterium]
MKFEWWMFVVGAVLSWGVYVPVLHEGQAQMGGGKPSDGAIRAFLCVGIAYFITAVVIPLIALYFGWAGTESIDFKDANGDFKSRAVTFATLGGIAGAAGALCIIFSIKFGGNPLFVAPLVFAGAPIVNAIVSVIWHWKPAYTKPEVQNGWIIFGAGILLAAVGAGLVLYSKGSIDSAIREAQKKENEAKAKPVAPAVAQAPPSLESNPQAVAPAPQLDAISPGTPPESRP